MSNLPFNRPQFLNDLNHAAANLEHMWLMTNKKVINAVGAGHIATDDPEIVQIYHNHRTFALLSAADPASFEGEAEDISLYGGGDLKVAGAQSMTVEATVKDESNDEESKNQESNNENGTQEAAYTAGTNNDEAGSDSSAQKVAEISNLRSNIEEPKVEKPKQDELSTKPEDEQDEEDEEGGDLRPDPVIEDFPSKKRRKGRKWAKVSLLHSDVYQKGRI